MIKLKGKTLIITGKDEKLLKYCAKNAKTTPRKLLLKILQDEIQTCQVIDNDILIKKLK